jgi:Uncharacterised nucleotidyltransferase
MDNSTREIELLLCCARADVDPVTAERIQTLLQKNIDWSDLMEKAAQHGVIPLLYKSIEQTCPEEVPSEILKELRNYFLANQLHNIFLTKELLELLNLFETHGICAIPYKGPALAAVVYDNLALRQFSDLDILVLRQDLLKARGLMLAKGYQSALEQWSVDREATYIQFFNQCSLIRNDGSLSVDLHGEVTASYFPFALEFKTLWERRVPVSLLETSVSHMSLEDLLLILCVHGSKHCWERLAWIVDLAELIRTHPNLDCERVLAQARLFGSERMVLLGLFLARELFDPPLPPIAVQKMQAEPEVKLLAEQVLQSLFCPAENPSDVLKLLPFYVRLRENLLDQMVQCFWILRKAIMPYKEDWEFLPLPPQLFFLYYLLRPIRLLGKYELFKMIQF